MLTTASAELALYQKLDELHGFMLHAAQSLDWDRVSELEANCADLSKQLSQLPGTSLNAEQQRQIKNQLLEMLNKRGLIVEEISAWRRDVEPLLRTFNKQSG